MRFNHLAVVVPVDTGAQNEGMLRTEVWGKVTRLLTPSLGKLYARFEPATAAWGQTLSDPYGVVLGKSEPALFLYFYEAAKTQQERAIQFHMKGFLDGLEPIAKNEDAGISVFRMEVKGDGEAMGAHMLWHMSMITGELLPDCGVYYLARKEAFAADTLNEDVLGHLPSYALCMVTLVVEDAE